MENKFDNLVSSNPGGIANRIKCLVSMWRICDKYNKKLGLDWVLNHTCGADFNKLFENEFERVDKIKDYKSPEDSMSSETWRFLTLPGEIQDGFAKVYPTKKGNNIDFEFHSIPNYVRNNILHYLHQLKPIKIIRNTVDNFANKHNVKKLVGVHIRRDDFLTGKARLGYVSSDNKFIEKMNQLIKQNENTKFLLCTDSQETEDKFKKEFGERIIIYPKKNRDRTSIIATQQGLVDLLLLSKTKHIIGTYQSTFNELAWWFGDCKAKVDIIIDEDLNKDFVKRNEKLEKSKFIKLKRYLFHLFRK